MKAEVDMEVVEVVGDTVIVGDMAVEGDINFNYYYRYLKRMDLGIKI